MRHSKIKYQINRFTSWRKATLKSMAKSLLIHQSIKTTRTKAKAARPLIEKLISLAKLNSLAARRQAFKILGDHKLISILFNDIGPRFNNRTGGYTRILNLGARRGDNAERVILELTEIKKKEPKKPGVKKELKPEEEGPAEVIKEKPPIPPPIEKMPPRKFLGGLRKIFKKERDSL